MKDESENFAQAVYDLVESIPPGKVMSYGAVGAALLRPNAARQVARLMRCAPERTPCHRVVRSDGRLAPADAFPEQQAMLRAEGAPFDENGRIIMKKARHNPFETPKKRDIPKDGKRRSSH